MKIQIQKLSSTFKNIFYKFRGIKKVGDSQDAIYYKCLRCGSDLKVHKGYAKVHVVCKCGNTSDVYTGEDIHFRSDPENKNTGREKNPKRSKEISYFFSVRMERLPPLMRSRLNGISPVLSPRK